MRLWHQFLISKLPRQQLLGQHRECCALRGMGWGKKHSVVNYVFEHPYYWLFLYHELIMNEMTNRGYSLQHSWRNPTYRGQTIGFDTSEFTKYSSLENNCSIYPEHNEQYLKECLENLERKGIKIL